MTTALHWFRRDLRVADNTALTRAVRENGTVWPVFVFDPKILTAPDTGAARVQYLLDSLASLQKNLEAKGSVLVVRQGEVVAELDKLVRETGAQAIYWNRDYEPYARRRDEAVARHFQSLGVATHSCKDGVILEPEEVLKADGTPYAVFTPYARVWRSKAQARPLPAVSFSAPLPAPPSGMELPTLTQLGFSTSVVLPRAGERAALDRLRLFISQSVTQYRSRRDFPALEGTSRLSADLRFGTLSPRQVVAAAEKAKIEHPEAAAETEVFISELIWREFYRQILWHYPHVEGACFKPSYDTLAWENNERYFQAWCEGRTGFPLVDAAMRQLNQTGWMHNRLRMVVSSFLTKDLLVDWKWGERYFMQKLVDGDLASNNGGWQWSASTGTDAQPYFRIFNPNAQAQRYDPEGKFIARFVPEASTFGYPPPLVDHAVQRQKALRLFKRI